jgi:hypothetical protein
MGEHHGATTIKQWMEDLVSVVRSGQEFDIRAGAEPGRCYSYLEYHLSEEQHSILLFRVEEGDDGPCMRAYRIDGSAEELSGKVNALVHAA